MNDALRRPRPKCLKQKPYRGRVSRAVNCTSLDPIITITTLGYHIYCTETPGSLTLCNAGI